MSIGSATGTASRSTPTSGQLLNQAQLLGQTPGLQIVVGDDRLPGTLPYRRVCLAILERRHVDLQFLRDGNIVGSELDRALGGRYSVAGEMLTLYGSRQRYFRIEGMTDNHMVLS
jgi:hypothetical protein